MDILLHNKPRKAKIKISKYKIKKIFAMPMLMPIFPTGPGKLILNILLGLLIAFGFDFFKVRKSSQKVEDSIWRFQIFFHLFLFVLMIFFMVTFCTYYTKNFTCCKKIFT